MNVNIYVVGDGEKAWERVSVWVWESCLGGTEAANGQTVVLTCEPSAFAAGADDLSFFGVNSHCLMPFGLRIGEGPAAAPCALVTKSAEADERGRCPRFNMCGFTNISPTSSTYSHLLCVFLCFQDGSLVSTARRHCIVRCPAGCGRGPLASDLFSSCRNRCQEPNKKNKTWNIKPMNIYK